MPKAKILSHEERIAMTKGRSSLLQSIRDGKNLPPTYPGIEKLQDENFDENHCPKCGAELIHESSCVRCPNGCWSRC